MKILYFHRIIELEGHLVLPSSHLVQPFACRLKGDMVTIFKYLKIFHTEEGKVLLSVVSEDRTRTSGMKLQEADLGQT